MNTHAPNLKKNQLDISGKIKSQHLNRKAVIYIRQSTLQQVHRHQESTRLQYGLVDRAVILGWLRSDIDVIDDDLGCSGASTVGRLGFQRLVAEVGLDHVGIVLGLEMSRLSRSSRDWYQLLEVCAIFGTLIGDLDGIYDPSLYNDRLLLGLKGTMSEAELHILKQRMLEGKRAKARRGGLGMRVPMGYVRQPSGEVAKDPDEQAQSAIERVFELFERKRTINGVLSELVSQHIQMPYRVVSGLNKGDLAWHRPNRVTLSNLLHNPAYTGAYVYGRRPTDPRKKIPGRPSTGRTVASTDNWEVLIKDRFPAYISWSRYEQNLRQLQANTAQSLGAARNGPSLLSGLIICGRCGLRMSPCYTDNGKSLRYACNRMMIDYGEGPCQSLSGKVLDRHVTTLIFKALQPAALEISLAVAEDLEAGRQKQQSHWQQRLERAKIDVQRAHRQYNAVEPENRLVARTLERNWEEALAAEAQLKTEYEQFLAGQSAVLTHEERASILRLAQDIPMLWVADTTTAVDRQLIVRQLIERVLVTVIDDTENVQVEVHWQGGHKTQAVIARPVARMEQMSYYPQLLDRVKALHAQGHTAIEMAETLNVEGWKPPKRRDTYNASMVQDLLTRQGLSIGSPKQQHTADICREADEWTMKELAQQLHMPGVTLYAWLCKGKIKGRQVLVASRSIWLLHADAMELEQLRKQRMAQRVWINQARDEVH
jgi:DNA invertase Pin-like site-specific DNA recombinase